MERKASGTFYLIPKSKPVQMTIIKKTWMNYVFHPRPWKRIFPFPISLQTNLQTKIFHKQYLDFAEFIFYSSPIFFWKQHEKRKTNLAFVLIQNDFLSSASHILKTKQIKEKFLVSLFMGVQRAEPKLRGTEQKIILMLFFRPHRVNYNFDFIMCGERCFWDRSGSRH